VTDRELRRTAFGVAYRMLGSVADAEDVVQEAMLRLHQVQENEEIASPAAYLTTITTRLAIDQLRSARVKREQYFGPWLPEPVVTSDDDRVAEAAETADSLSLAFLVLLESLSPVERAVFLLHDVFDYDYDEIAKIVGKTSVNTRQLATRARRHVEERKPRFDADQQQREELADRFFAAAQDGNVDGLLELLAADAVLYGDGGGKGPAVPEPVFGRERVGRVLAAIASQIVRAGLQIKAVEVNGQPGAMFVDERDRIATVMSLDIANGQVQAIRSIVNPDKLGHLGDLADFKELARRLHERARAPRPE
jgi:RNA polymerase sigma-70 factor (ECF subfamily)